VTTETTITVRELRGTICRCGAPKRKGHSFCSKCYYRLPPPLRQRLYLDLSNGYLAAFETALTYLTERGAE
jgi:hypothetical protein